MRTSITKLESWLLNRLLKRLVIQGNHATNIEDLYLRMRMAMLNEYTEDTIPTIDRFLQDHFDNSQKYTG